MEFDVLRNTLASANTSSIRVYNLSKINRSLIKHDLSDPSTIQQVELRAGYGSIMAVIFTGNIQQAWSVREGNNFITQMESYDGGDALINGITNFTFNTGTAQKTIIEKLAASLPNVTVGQIGDYPGNCARGNTYSGNTGELLNTLTGGGFYIDNGKAYCLNDNEAIEGEIEIINPKSGLLGTPVRENIYVNIELIFEPRVQLGQIIELQSITGDNVNGTYKVIGLHHRGTISSAVCGDAVTSLRLNKSLQKLDIVT